MAHSKAHTLIFIYHPINLTNYKDSLPSEIDFGNAFPWAYYCGVGGFRCEKLPLRLPCPERIDKLQLLTLSEILCERCPFWHYCGITILVSFSTSAIYELDITIFHQLTWLIMFVRKKKSFNRLSLLMIFLYNTLTLTYKSLSSSGTSISILWNVLLSIGGFGFFILKRSEDTISS